jgi:hypothetical protein
MAHGGHDAIELIAALVLVVGGALFTIRAFRTRPAPPGPAASVVADGVLAGAAVEPLTVDRSISLMLAGLSAGAAVIHLVAAPTHYLELGDLGAGFLIAAALQGAWIRPCLAGPSRRTALAGIALNGALVVAWAWSRSVGLPVGPFAGGPEPIGLPDGASVVFELILMTGLSPIALGPDLRASRRIVRELAAIAIVPVVGLVFVVTSLATVAIATGLDHGSGGGQPVAAHVASP